MLASRDRELLADKKGAQLVSSRVAARALVKTHILSMAYQHSISQYAQMNSEERLESLDVVGKSLLSDDKVRESIFETSTSHPLDSHPPLTVRLQNLCENITADDAKKMIDCEHTSTAFQSWLSKQGALFSEIAQESDAELQEAYVTLNV